MKSDSRQPTNCDIEPGVAALEWAVSRGMAEHVAAETRAKARRIRRLRVLRVTAAVVCFGALVGVIWKSRVSLPAALQPPASAVIAAPARQVLPDGTVVDLKDGALIDSHVAAGGQQTRRVVLIRGEAHFQVAHDSSRPFIVSANAVAVRAIGTAFVVELGRDAVEVVVTEGKVAVEQDEGLRSRDHGSGTGKLTLSLHQSLAPLRIDSGNRVRIEIAGASAAAPLIVPVPPEEMSERLAWRVPRIEFSGTRLSEAIPLFNRYSPMQLVMGDASLGELRLSGVLRPDRPLTLLHLLKIEFGIEAVSRGENELVLRRR